VEAEPATAISAYSRSLLPYSRSLLSRSLLRPTQAISAEVAKYLVVKFVSFVSYEEEDSMYLVVKFVSFVSYEEEDSMHVSRCCKVPSSQVRVRCVVK